MVYYFDNKSQGLIIASSDGDGYSIQLKWHKAFASNKTNSIGYHIYMATDEDNVFSEGPKFVSIDGSLKTTIYELVPGEMYYFAVRAFEYSPVLFDINNLQRAFSNLIVYPNSLLIADITATSTLIPVMDAEIFPNFGVVQIGYEMIDYSSINTISNNLILTSTAQRGFFSTNARFHNTDGYDGYNVIFPPLVHFTFGREETNKKISSCESRFEYPYYQYTQDYGFHQVTKDILTTDLAASDASNENFPTYDYAGYHRTNPVELVNGTCVGSYIGGEMFCADGYSGVGRMVRGLSVQNQNTQRQDILLNLTGEGVVLLKRMWEGITCSCYTPGQEDADDRCPYCYGTKFVMGYNQYYNPRRSDGKILVRFGPADDDVVTTDSGFESTFTTDCWTLTVPTVKDRDILIRFDQDGNEEFRYEILSVNRNKLLLDLQGVQKFRVQRIRKYDIAYQIRAFRDTAFIPQAISTTLSSTRGIPSHSHTIVINESITDVSQINQTTGISYGHNHAVINGVIGTDVLEHSHIIILPSSSSTPSNQGSTGVISSSYNAPPTATVGQLVAISANNTVVLASSGNGGNYPAIGFIGSKPTTSQAIVQYEGEIGGFTGLVPDAIYYLSSTPGAFTLTAPVLSGFIVQEIGVAKNSTTLVIKIDMDYTLL